MSTAYVATKLIWPSSSKPLPLTLTLFPYAALRGEGIGGAFADAYLLDRCGCE